MSGAAVEVLLGLGGNLGDRFRHLCAGRDAVAALPGVTLLRASGVWESAFVGEGTQPDYLNACLLIRTALAPPELFDGLPAVERAAGRLPATHLQPRPLDLDILLWAGVRHRGPDLVIPHPRLAERAFVLEPLAQIAPDWVHPDSGQTVAELCDMIRAVDGPWVRPLPLLDLSREGCDA